MDAPLFIVSKDDWSLHRKGYEDQMRHQDKVKEAIRNHLPDIISEESIILSNGREIIKIPIRSLDEFRFRYNFNKSKHVGQGDGDSQVGDVIGREPSKGDKGQSGAGDQAGEDYYEAEVSFEEVEKMLYAELELPFMQQKQKDQLETIDIVFNDIRKKGIMGNIDKKRTILEAIRRNAMEGKKGLHQISNDDLRFKTWEEKKFPHSNAVVIAMMDTSGSMGLFEKFVARSFFFWTVRFLRTKYEKVEIVFLAHHTEAKEVTEEEFFTKGESGGTICSSVYYKALDIIDKRYSPSQYNIYPIHFSDGDNLTSDNERCLQLVGKLMDQCNMFGYAEVNQYNRNSTLMSAYRNLKNERFIYSIIREKGDVYKALKTFFSKRDPVLS